MALHYITKHKLMFEKHFPEDAAVSRKIEYDQRLQSHLGSQHLLSSAISSNDCVTEASFRICYLLVKYKKAFSDAEIMKQCFIAGSESVFSSFANKEKILTEIKKLPLSTYKG